MKKICTPWMMWALVVCTGCSVLQGGAGGAPVSLEDRDWKLVALDGKEVLTPPGGQAPYLRLMSADGRVVGHGGCNRFFGGYKLDGDGLRFSALGSTKMACPGDIDRLEQALFNALGSARRFKLSGDMLELSGETAPLARFRAADKP
jgi:heat shock protein HslJ